MNIFICIYTAQISTVAGMHTQLGLRKFDLVKGLLALNHFVKVESVEGWEFL